MTKPIKKYRIILTALFGAALAILVIFGMFSIDNATNSLAISYIESQGWQVEQRPVEISHITLPEDFDIIYQTYNALQKESGFDLTAYKGQRLARYSYRVLNHEKSEQGEIRANVFVFQQQIVAADISAASAGGFMHPITDPRQHN
uniref:DUF4830 domain-containing protein n=1 Tax=uncultured Bacillota bacterium TaxID=344338 RepID=A0A650EMV0_9FIRM|nr:hypothetical protein Firmicute1046_1750 [uncultured Firmicutes bacterium]